MVRATEWGRAEDFGRVLYGDEYPSMLELVLRKSTPGADFESLPDPFVRVDDIGGVGALFLGRLKGVGFSGRTVVIKVQKDGCTSRYPDPVSAPRNPVQERVFLENYVSLKALTEQARGTVPRIAPFASPATPERDLEPVLPVFFCKRRRVFFHPPCGDCGHPLTDCIDDHFLMHRGLHSYSETNRRYLYCPKCGDGHAQVTALFACTVEPGERPLVGDQRELIRSFKRLLGHAGEHVSRTFPCTDCTDSVSCYPGSEANTDGDAVRLLVPFSFYSFRTFVHEFLPLRYDEFCDLLGGGGWENVGNTLTERGEFERLEAAKGLGKSAERYGGLFFGDDPSGRVSLEVLCLKLALFRDLCKCVQAIHKTLERPHLNLRPANAWVEFRGGTGFAPPLWTFRLCVRGLDGAWPVAGPGWGEAKRDRLFLPPTDYEAPYCHPSIAAPRVDDTAPGRLNVLGIEEENPGEVVVLGRLTPASRKLSSCTPGDCLELSFGRNQGFQQEFSVVFQLKELGGEAALLRSVPLPLAEKTRERFRSLQAVPQIDVTFSVLHRFGPECDLHSLGVMLFRTLLVNSAQDARRVFDRCRSVNAQLQRLSRSPTVFQVTELCREETFDPRNLLFHPSESTGEAVPEELWARVLTIGFRLTTGIPGFSYIASETKAAQRTRRAAIDSVIDDIKDLEDIARRALFFEPPGAQRDIHAVLRELIDDPDWLERILPPPRREGQGAQGTQGTQGTQGGPELGLTESREVPDSDATLVQRGEAAAGVRRGRDAIPREAEQPRFGGAPEELHRQETLVLKTRDLDKTVVQGGAAAPGDTTTELGPDTDRTAILEPEKPGRDDLGPPDDPGAELTRPIETGAQRPRRPETVPERTRESVDDLDVTVFQGAEAAPRDTAAERGPDADRTVIQKPKNAERADLGPPDDPGAELTRPIETSAQRPRRPETVPERTRESVDDPDVTVFQGAEAASGDTPAERGPDADRTVLQKPQKDERADLGPPDDPGAELTRPIETGARRPRPPETVPERTRESVDDLDVTVFQGAEAASGDTPAERGPDADRTVLQKPKKPGRDDLGPPDDPGAELARIIETGAQRPRPPETVPEGTREPADDLDATVFQGAAPRKAADETAREREPGIRGRDQPEPRDGEEEEDDLEKTILVPLPKGKAKK